MRVAVLDDWENAASRSGDWPSLGPDITAVYFPDHIPAADDLARQLAGFEIICLMRERTRFDAALIARLPALRLLITTGPSNAAIDLEAATKAGVLVCGTPAELVSTTELTWALILAVTRRLPFEDRAVRAGRWGTTIGPVLHGKTLGLIGLGRLGSRVAAIGQAFGMRTVAWSQNLTSDVAAKRGCVYLSRDDLLNQADVITIHLKLSPRTRGLIGRAEIARMKSTAYLINTSRGPIIDEAALIEALSVRKIAGAALDVFDQEPLRPDHPLRGLDNAVLSPHRGYVAEENYRLYYGGAIDAIRAWRAGRPVMVLNPAVLTSQ